MEVINRLADKYGVRLSPGSVGEFASVLELNHYSKDEIILDQGQVSRYLYIVHSGMIRQFYYKEGRNITEHFSCEGDVASCLVSLFLSEPTRLLVEAIEPSAVYLLDYAGWLHICDHNPEINGLHRRIFEYKLIVSQRKADSWRFESSHERYERFQREYPSVSKRASVAHIASYLLMSPETLSRVRAGVL